MVRRLGLSAALGLDAPGTSRVPSPSDLKGTDNMPTPSSRTRTWVIALVSMRPSG
ncbi:MAG: hypothetical protein OSB03_04380 [Vicinamibacterales bacterium]|nr:hypothetical protein [Vicinamibacterales bacterium]